MHEDRKQRVWDWLFPLLFVGAAIVALFATVAKGEERVLSEATVAHGGLICDTTTEVTDFITATENGTPPEEALEGIKGCGVLVRPSLIRIVALGDYTTNRAKYLIVRYEFLASQHPHQFGIMGKVDLIRL